jgi:hypothetical protein
MIVEDGMIVTDANSYVTVAFADAYHNARGNSAWTGTDAVKESALIRATDYIEQVYSGRWIGHQQSDNQDLSWPRTFLHPFLSSNDYHVSGQIPKSLKQAVCVLALESFTDELNPVRDRAIRREKVDVIEVEYMDNARNGKSRPAIDGLLRPYLNGTALNGQVVRV